MPTGEKVAGLSAIASMRVGVAGGMYPVPESVPADGRAEWLVRRSAELGCRALQIRDLPARDEELKALRGLAESHEIELETSVRSVFVPLGRPVTDEQAGDLRRELGAARALGMPVVRTGYGRLTLETSRYAPETDVSAHLRHLGTCLRSAAKVAGALPRARTADAPGEHLWQAELAGTLRAIAHAGPDALREGPIAAAIAAAIAAEDGILDAEDLASYTPKVLTERPGRYRDLEYVTACDLVGYEALNILDRFPLGELEAGGAEHLHLIAEALGHAFVDNVTHYGDPDHTQSPIDGLASAEFAAMRAAGIALDRAAPRPIAPADPWPYDTRPRPGESPPPSVGGVRGTTQVVAADADGNLVSLITTIGDDFGSLLAVPDTGLVLNNSMMNYDPRPGRAGSIAPGKMPFFAVPALVAARDGRGVFAAAGSGGYPILTGVLCTFLNAIDHRMPIAAAAEQPRVHTQGDRTFIDRRVAPRTRERLAQMGHELVVQDVTPGELPFSRVGAVLVEDQLCASCSPSWNTAVGGL